MRNVSEIRMVIPFHNESELFRH